MFPILLRTTLEGAIVVAFIWVISRTLRRLSPAAQAILWWCAAVKFLIAILWTTPIALPLLPPADLTIHEIRAPAQATIDGHAIAVFDESDKSSSPSRPAWGSTLVGLWAVGCLGATVIALRRWRRTAAAINRSACAQPSIQEMAGALGRRLALKTVPVIRVSDEVSTPLVAGLRHPTVVLPGTRFMALPAEQQQMALCHELAHVKRRDLWFGLAPALVERLFFFHPLVHLAAREYAFWREAACDAAVIAALDAPPQEYGRLLLHLGIARPRPALAAAGASWSYLNLKRRIAMLPQSSRRPVFTRLLAVSATVICAAAMVPVRITARPESPSRPTVSVERTSTGEFPQSKERRLNFVLFVDEHSTTSSGSMADIERARRYRRGGEQLLWFRHEGREFVVRDQRIMEEVLAIWLPVNEIGTEQGRLGGEQGAIGAKQGELGAKQGALGSEQGRLGARQGALGARQGTLAAQQAALGENEARRRAFDKEQKDIEREMDALDHEMKQIDAKMQALNEPMRELGEQMADLGAEMTVLGRKMEEASQKADAEMRALLERLVSSGTAEAVK